jgi:hypothetical protein
MSMYWNVCPMMVTLTETRKKVAVLNITLCFDWTIILVIQQHNGMAPIKKDYVSMLILVVLPTPYLYIASNLMDTILFLQYNFIHVS